MASAQRQQVFLELLAEGGHTGQWTYHRASGQLWLDVHAQRLLHCSAAASLAEMLGAVHDTDRQALLADIEHACTTQTGFARRIALRADADAQVHLALRGRWYRDEARSPGELLCVVEQELPQQYLQASIGHLMDSNMVGMIVGEASGTIVEANDHFLSLLGRTRCELESGSLNWIELSEPSSRDISLRMRDRMLHTGTCPPYEKSFLRPDGSAVAMLVALTRLPGNGDRALAITLDISEQKKVQEQLQALNAQLEKRTDQAEQAEAAKTLFLSSISHELRTPLHTMLGYARLLRKKAQGQDEQQLAIVEGRGSHLLRLIDELLEFNHTLVAPEELHTDFLAMEGFIGSLEAMFAPVAEASGNQFVLNLAEVLPVGIVVDEGRLVQILRILVDNACKYSAEGVVILTIDCPGRVDEDGRCRLYFAVEDTGRGIDAADREHIFEPLHRGRNAKDRPGLGLGLAIAEQWIRRMGSHIEVRSEVGVGSCFGFELLLQASFEQRSRWREPHPPRLQGRKPQVPADIPYLPEADLAQLGQLIGMGRMGRLGNWARDLSERHPELQGAAQQVASLAARAEVDALERLYRRWAA